MSTNTASADWSLALPFLVENKRRRVREKVRTNEDKG